jgi:hypothetical protein
VGQAVSWVVMLSPGARASSSTRGHNMTYISRILMKGKLEQKRQEVIQEILRGYGSLDRIDAICLGVRFKCSPEAITEDVRNAQEALKHEASAQQHAARETQERVAELALARKILKSGGV